MNEHPGREHSYRCRQKYKDHPGCCDIGKFRHLLITEHRYHCGNCPHDKYGNYPANDCWGTYRQRRHGDMKRDANRGSGNGDHGTGQETKHNAIHHIIHFHQLAPANFF